MNRGQLGAENDRLLALNTAKPLCGEPGSIGGMQDARHAVGIMQRSVDPDNRNVNQPWASTTQLGEPMIDLQSRAFRGLRYWAARGTAAISSPRSNGFSKFRPSRTRRSRPAAGDDRR